MRERKKKVRKDKALAGSSTVECGGGVAIRVVPQYHDEVKGETHRDATDNKLLALDLLCANRPA